MLILRGRSSEGCKPILTKHFCHFWCIGTATKPVVIFEILLILQTVGWISQFVARFVAICLRLLGALPCQLNFAHNPWVSSLNTLFFQYQYLFSKWLLFIFSMTVTHSSVVSVRRVLPFSLGNGEHLGRPLCCVISVEPVFVCYCCNFQSSHCSSYYR